MESENSRLPNNQFQRWKSVERRMPNLNTGLYNHIKMTGFTGIKIKPNVTNKLLAMYAVNPYYNDKERRRINAT